MPRPPRFQRGDHVYHLVNRAAFGITIFQYSSDYKLFESLLFEARVRFQIRILAYCLMPNHWHILVWPRADGRLAEFAHWLTSVHAHRWNASRGRTGRGSLYQNRYKSKLIHNPQYYWAASIYIELNPVRARLVATPSEWPWSSFLRRATNNHIDDGPIPFPPEWTQIVTENLFHARRTKSFACYS